MATHYIIYCHYLCCLASKNKLWLKRCHVIYNIPMHAETVKMLNNPYIFTKIVHAILVYIVHKFRDLVKGNRTCEPCMLCQYFNKYFTSSRKIILQHAHK